jgi:biopolymer transport protein ExbD
MKLTSRRHGAKIDLQMTSMIDCVFLLLIFFMVTSSFSLAERELDTGIKVQRTASRAASDLAPTIVDIVRGGSSKFIYKVGSRELATSGELTDVLRQFDNKLDGAFVRAADEAPFNMAANAVQACKSAGFTLVSYVPLGNDKPGSDK